MRVAQVAPLMEAVPPRLYGGTERVVSYLTEELVRRGHEVTLFASADSSTRADLAPMSPHGLRLAGEQEDAPSYHVMEMMQVLDRADEFDVIHAHVDVFGLALSRLTRVSTVHTMHGRMDGRHWRTAVERFPEAWYVSISDEQRRPVDDLRPRWAGTVYHGFPDDAFEPGPGDGGYLLYLSRMSEEKHPEVAVSVASRTGIPLLMAGKVDAGDREFFESRVEPKLADPLITYRREVDDEEKKLILSRARALLFPIDWPEPFGMVMVEAMAVGTPVIARRRGSVPEVVDDGVTGFIVEDEDDMVEAVGRLDEINRLECSRRAWERFSVGVMAENYERIYQEVTQTAGG